MFLSLILIFVFLIRSIVIHLFLIIASDLLLHNELLICLQLPKQSSWHELQAIRSAWKS